MYKDHYYAIQTYLEDRLNSVQRALGMDMRPWSVEQYQEQYSRIEELRMGAFPVVYYELVQPIAWTTSNQKQKVADEVTLRLHLVDKNLENTSDHILLMAKHLLESVEGSMIEDDEVVYFRSLRMKESEQKIIKSNVHAFVISFSTEMRMSVNPRNLTRVAVSSAAVKFNG